MKSASCKLNAVLVAFAVLPHAAHGEVTYSHIKVPVAVVCRDPTMTAYLESSDSPPHFSPQWESIGGHSHCGTMKNDRPLIIVKSVSVTRRGKTYPMVEMFPAGIIVSTDGFGGPYFLLASHIANMPGPDQLRENVKAFLPTSVDYSTPKMGPTP